MSGLPTPYQRPDGRWTAQVSTGYSNGKRSRKTVYGRTAAECRKKLIEVLHGQQNGQAPMDERTTLATFLPRWLDNIAPSLRPHTRRFYGDQARLHIIPKLGGLPISRITPEQVQHFVNAKSAEGLSPRMVRHLRGTLRAALNQAVEWQLIARNPAAARIRLPQLNEREVNALTADEVKALLSVSATDAYSVSVGEKQLTRHKLHALWVVAVYLGLRQSEILGLRWSSIDWTNVTLRVDKQLQRVDGRLVLTEPKTKGSVRTLPMPPTVAAALRDHAALQDVAKQEAARLGNNVYRMDGYVFATAIGTPIDPRNLIREWHALLKRAKLRRIRFHDLRHTAATLMLSAGVDIKLVAETLGHRDATMVLKVYGHVLPHQRNEAAQKMEAILG